MGLFRRSQPGELSEAELEQRRKRRDEDTERISKGGLPLDATERLQGLANGIAAGVKPLFTSTLSTNELLLLREVGMLPLGQVMGASVYQTSASGTSAISGELKFLTKAYNEVQRLALERLRQEAILLGAHGVVGVQLKCRIPFRAPEDYSNQILEFSAMGTAIQESGRRAPELPFLSALSGQEYVTLQRTGYRPLGLILGNCAYYKVANPPAALSRTLSGLVFGVNCERTDYTECLYKARHHAMERMESEALLLKAEGIVGVTVQMEHHFGSETGLSPDLFCHYFAMGTAVGRDRFATPAAPATLTLPLS